MKNINKMLNDMKKDREFIEWTIKWLNTKKETRGFVILKELKNLNQIFDPNRMDCIQIRVKNHFGTEEEFNY